MSARGTLTTYNFHSDSFGHATMLVGGPMHLDGQLDNVLAILKKKRAQLLRETLKKSNGLPYDKRFVHGHE